jgi:hypothetical protein
VKELRIQVPEDIVALCTAVVERSKAKTQPPKPKASVPWTPALATLAVEHVGDFEGQLLWRVADARGARVPLSELRRDLGLPAEAALDRDFPAVSAYCASGGGSTALPALPVISGGTGDEAWYWMDPFEGIIFRDALKTKLFDPASS